MRSFVLVFSVYLRLFPSDVSGFININKDNIDNNEKILGKGWSWKDSTSLGQEHNKNFTYFVFNQAWPTSVCIEGKEGSHHKCPKILNETGWTIHGLWPSIPHSKTGPFYCNSSAKFNETAIQSLLPKLHAYWPNLYIDTSPNSFWSHEWEKHGTCATSVPTTANEFLYFKKGLQLYNDINLTGLMEQLGFIPDNNKTYSVFKILEGLTGKLNGIKPIINCLKYPDGGNEGKFRYNIFFVEICFNKQFNMEDCKMKDEILYFKSFKNEKLKSNGNSLSLNDDHLADCPSSGEIYYPTIHSV